MGEIKEIIYLLKSINKNLSILTQETTKCIHEYDGSIYNLENGAHKMCKHCGEYYQ